MASRHLSLCLLLAACGGSGDAIPLNRLGTELATMACAQTFECCTSTEITDQFAGFSVNGEPITTEEQCDSYFTAWFNAFATEQYQASIDAGRITYDGDRARACIDAAAGLGCSAYSRVEAATYVACDEPFIIPQVADGAACSQSYECTSGYCSAGTCAPLPAAGDPCAGPCAHGLQCSYDATAMANTCQPLLANGGACAGDSQCASNHCDGSMCTDRPPVCDGT